MPCDPVDALIIEALRRCRKPTSAPKLLALQINIRVSERTIQRRLLVLEQRGMVSRPQGLKKGWVLTHQYKTPPITGGVFDLANRGQSPMPERSLYC